MSLTVDKVSEKYKKFVNPSIARAFNLVGCGIEAHASGAVVIDAGGREYIDAAGGFGVFNLGHTHPVVVNRVREQLERMPLSSRAMYNEPLARLAELLASITPGRLQYSFICNSGTEAVDGALKLARASTGKPNIIATVNAFHGKALGSLSAAGNEMYRRPFYPLLEGLSVVPYGDAAAVEANITDRTAAVIVEPVQGEGGVIVPPGEYFPRLREVCA